MKNPCLLGIVVLLSACNSSELAVEAKDAAQNCESHFAKSVQPELDYCRTCHVPGGVSDVPEGQRFMLREEPAEDYVRLRNSWETLGRNDNGPSPILTMSSGTDARSHSGGDPWPTDSEAYKAMELQLQGFEDPQTCPG